jgi:hypothetical protein
MPISEVSQSKERTSFGFLKTGLVGSNPARGIDVPYDIRKIWDCIRYLHNSSSSAMQR